MLYDMLNERLQTIWINNGHPQITNMELVVFRNTVLSAAKSKQITQCSHCLPHFQPAHVCRRQGVVKVWHQHNLCRDRIHV